MTALGGTACRLATCREEWSCAIGMMILCPWLRRRPAGRDIDGVERGVRGSSVNLLLHAVAVHDTVFLKLGGSLGKRQHRLRVEKNDRVVGGDPAKIAARAVPLGVARQRAASDGQDSKLGAASDILAAVGVGLVELAVKGDAGSGLCIAGAVDLRTHRGLPRC